MGEVRDGATTWESQREELTGQGGGGYWFFLFTRGDGGRGCLQSWERLELPRLQLRRCCTQSVLGPLFCSPLEHLNPFYISICINAEVSQISSWDPGSFIHPLACHLYQDIPQAPQTQTRLTELIPFTWLLLSQPIRVGSRSLTHSNPNPFPSTPLLVNDQIRLVNLTPKLPDHHLEGQAAIASHGIGVTVSSVVSLSLLLSSSNIVRSIVFYQANLSPVSSLFLCAPLLHNMFKT